MPCTGAGVYGAGRAVASAPAPETDGSLFAAFLGAALFAVGFFVGAALFAAGFFVGAAFLAVAAPLSFFIFMGRTLPQRAGGGQVTRGVGPGSL